MSAAALDFCSGLLDQTDVGAIWRGMADFGRASGFDACSLTMVECDGSSLRSVLFKSDLPDEFQRLYLDGGLISHDPFLTIGCRNIRVKMVGAQPHTKLQPPTRGKARFLECAADFGAVAGLGIPVRDRRQARWGGWIFSSSSPEPKEAGIKASTNALRLAGMLAYERIEALSLPTYRPLSGRERDCLHYLAQGLRVARIADRLAISPSAVNLYVANAKRKLGAATREQAVARAIVSGDICS